MTCNDRAYVLMTLAVQPMGSQIEFHTPTLLEGPRCVWKKLALPCQLHGM